MVPYDWWVGDEAMERTMAWTRYDDTLQLAEDMNRSILGDERWEGLRESTKAMLCSEGAAFRADMACQAQPLFDVDALKVPLVAGHGTAMPDEFIAANRRLAERTGADMYVGDGVDHFAHLSAPEVWAGLVRRTVALARA
jgi:pimeloyl-ACP methyl ester carboxylesterase